MPKGDVMSAEKMKRLIVASVVSAVLLLTVLLSIMVYQMVAMRVTQNKIDRLNYEIAQLENQKQAAEDGITLWTSEWKIEERARELDWVYGTDK